ncbi:hypothetical protein [Flagellimonas myxillae]|uniref:hypothetical protein n=1 Tax=Flagellimonas myxillae TaxID=2942214 RepID=UPI00201F49A8|nr:hypothetical protein [Muricauda myxillae]MCL6266039.1 hypothetical protein [Muricauda myxillae]
MKKISFFLFGIILLSILTISCENEESIAIDAPQIFDQSIVVVEEVDFNSVPELSEALNGISGKSNLARSYSEKGDAKYWINEESVLKLRDSVNNESFAVVIHTDDPSSRSFYNLIVTKRVDGNPIVPFVVEYNFENGDVHSFAKDDEKEFDGTVNIYSIDGFASITGLSSKENPSVICFPDVGQPNTTTVGNSSSSSAGGTSGGTSNSGSSGTGGSNISYSRPHISVTKTRSKGSVSVGQGTFYMPPLAPTGGEQKTVVAGKDKNPCPEGWVSVPINEITLFEDRIDDLALAQCLKKILNNLKQSKTGVGNIIVKFAGNSPDFNWEVLDGSLAGGTGQTSNRYNRSTGTVTTIFDSQRWKNATELSWARTMLHESVHAYIVASFGANYINASKTYASLYNDFLNKTYPNNNATHHAEMARNFVKDIGLSLREYGISQGYSFSNQFYDDMAWGGLTDWEKRDSSGNIMKDSNGNTLYEETPWFKSAVPSASDRKRIKDIFTIELIGKDTNGNNKTQKGKNAGC